MTDTARAAALETIARHLAERDRTPSADRPDPEVDAAVLLQGLVAQGWRPTAARPAPAWTPSSGRPAEPDAVRQHAAAARAALAGQTEEPTDER
ncbi:hypothetical protein ABZ249_25460 [Nocardiopsis sp. NPDC006139]|uniref:hypothetical protein n=1 Tax=Nocardiopsis sp. NPDC006139 TaxID=3154578 RepID=UPI0033A8D84A